jgi:hypothetical protein
MRERSISWRETTPARETSSEDIKRQDASVTEIRRPVTETNGELKERDKELVILNLNLKRQGAMMDTRVANLVEWEGVKNLQYHIKTEEKCVHLEESEEKTFHSLWLLPAGAN